MADACCDGCVQLEGDGRLIRVVGNRAYGYPAAKLFTSSFWTMCHEDDRQPIQQTMHALLATTNCEPDQGGSARSLRVLHRMHYWVDSKGRSAVTWMDTIMTSCVQEGRSSLLLSSRCALPTTGGEDMFRVFSSGPNV